MVSVASYCDGDTVSPHRKIDKWWSNIPVLYKIVAITVSVTVYVIRLEGKINVQNNAIENFKTQAAQMQREINTLNRAHIIGPTRIEP
jgi:hypothetical protein